MLVEILDRRVQRSLELCLKGPRSSTALQPSQGSECKALGEAEAAWPFRLQVWGRMLTERRSEPRTSTADCALGAPILCRKHPRTQKKTQEAGACWELRVRAGVGGPPPLPTPVRTKSRCSRPRSHDWLLSFPTPQTGFLGSFLELILFLLNGWVWFFLPFSSRKIKRRKAEKGRRIKTWLWTGEGCTLGAGNPEESPGRGGPLGLAWGRHRPARLYATPFIRAEWVGEALGPPCSPAPRPASSTGDADSAPSLLRLCDVLSFKILGVLKKFIKK